MAETTSAPSLRELSEAATQGEWRMRKHFISAPSTNPVIPGEDVVFSVAYSDRSHDDDNRNLAFVARLVSDYRAGRLIDPTAQSEAVASARAEGWQPIETAPRDRTPVMIAVPSLHADQPMIVGEAYFRPREEDGSVWDGDEWWWAGTGPGNYHDSPIHETNAAPTNWMPLPAPPTTPGGRTDG